MILDNINNPEDVKSLSIRELYQLADELRNFIIQSVSSTGGHLAPSLGTVELTIALLYTLNLPEDKLIWDVGHQCYGYKVLTGRKDSFHSLRQLGGISGFPRRDESEYDFFGTGHASTSISASLGFAKARDILDKNHNVVAVIGDGALTGGYAFEGLNAAGASNTELTVILNDNQMSISPNVGAISRYLTHFIVDPRYQRLKDEIWHLAELLPYSNKLTFILKKLDDSAKGLFTQGMLFEAFGFEYFGPINGHNIELLIETLENIKHIRKPKLLHILTQKGKGFYFSEENPVTFHGISPFEPETGEILKDKKEKSYTDVFGETVVELGERFDKLVTITAAMETGTGLTEFHRRFPERFFDVGIAEGTATILSAGLAAEGMIPVCAIYSTFLQRAYDSLIHDIALQRLPVVFAIDRAGVVGQDGPTHHGVFDIAYIRSIPSFILSAPKDGTELRNLLFTAVSQRELPFAIRYPRDIAWNYEEKRGFEEIPIGKWEKLSDGEIAIIATGTMVKASIEAGKLLSSEGIKPAIFNARFIKPMDCEMLNDIFTHFNIIFTVEEGTLTSGLGEEIATLGVAAGFKGKIIPVGIPDKFIEHGKREELLSILKLTPDGIKETILKNL